MNYKSVAIGISTIIILVLSVYYSQTPESIGNIEALERSSSFSGEVVNSSRDIVIEGATVFLVPVSAIDITSPITASAIYAAPYPAEAFDEPLEDTIRLKGDDFLQATTDADGKFVIENVPEGRFFVHVTPELGELDYLPGGDKSRRAYSSEQLVKAMMTIVVSSRPSANASYVGSSQCLGCHQDQQHWQETGHKLAWTVPGAPGALQDFSKFPDFFKALDSYLEVDGYLAGTRLELGDFDASRGADKFKLRQAGDSLLPIDKVYADIYLWREKTPAGEGKYYITMANRLNPNDPNSPAHLEIKLLYGGAVHDQRYIVAAPETLGNRPGWYTLLRYNLTGNDTHLNRQRREWHDYKFSLWWDAGEDESYGTGDDVVKAPPINENTIQSMCAGCHLTGWERYEDEATGQLLVRAVNDIGGAMNIDDDPEMDEINIGCESCHGPGSEHIESTALSRFIVNPKLLSAERSSVVCGRCHDRRQGYGGEIMGYTQALSETGELARPGISRHELITRFTDPVKKGPTMRGEGRDFNIWADDIHSSKPHQQYADFIKSKMYRNERSLLTCSTCHDMHGGTANFRSLVHDQNNPDSLLCQRCHEIEVNDHMLTQLGATMKGHKTRCIDCHMAPTANTGGIAGSYGRMIQTPPYGNASDEARNAYWDGPMRSHVFDVPLKTNIMVRGVLPGDAMPIPYTGACGTCHIVEELQFQ